MVPNHGDHCGPGHESEGPPKSDTDAACMRHDRCYGEAFTREEELLCDAEACNEIAHVVADDLGEHLYKEGMKMAFCNQPYSLAMEDKQMTQVPRQWGQPRRTRRDEYLNVDVEIKEQRVPGRRHISKKQSPESLLDEFEEEIRVSTTSAPREQFVQADGKKAGPPVPVKGKGYQAKKGKLLKRRAKNQKKRIAKKNRRANKGYRQGVKKRLKRAGVRPTVGVSEFAHKIEQDWNIMPMRGKGRKGDGIVLEGSDLLDVVSSGDTTIPVGTTTFTIPLAPTDTAWATTRLAQFVPLFQRYKFIDVKFVWEPACGTATGGQGIHFVDYDVDVSEAITPIAGTLNSVKVAAAKKRNKPFRFWEENIATYMPDGEIQTLFLTPGAAGSDPRLYSQGRYYLIVASPPPKETSLGILYVKYKIQLWDASYSIAPDPSPPAQDAFIWRYQWDLLPKEAPIESAEKLLVWLADLGELAPTFTNMEGVTVVSDLDTGIITFNDLPLGYTTVDAGIKFIADAVNDNIFTGGFPGSAIVPSQTIETADWVRVDCDDTAWRDAEFDNGASAAFGQENHLTPGAAERAICQVYGRSHFAHNVTTSPFKLFCGQAIGVECDTGNYHYTTWIDVIVIPPTVVKPCPHEVRARPLGKWFKSDLYVWHPEDACKHKCGYCEKQAIEYVPKNERLEIAKMERQAEKSKERQTMEEVMLYLLRKMEKADALAEVPASKDKAREASQSVDPVINGLMALPKPMQPKALMIMAECPCSCGRAECDICGCHELEGCESGMKIPRPSAEAIQLRMFWMTVLSNLNDEGALRDVAKRQGAYRSIRAFLSLDLGLGKEK